MARVQVLRQPGTAGEAGADPDLPPIGFSQLLRWHRETAGLSQEALAARARLAVRTISDIEGGTPRRTRPGTVQQLAVALGLSEAERTALMVAAFGQRPGMIRDVLSAAELREARPPTIAAPGTPPAAIGVSQPPLEQGNWPGGADWGEAPDTAAFQGRGDELETLTHWLLGEHCRVVALLGLGGMGKTMLAARLAHALSAHFDRIFWRSLQNALSADEWLDEALRFLAVPRYPALSESFEARLTALISVLRERRCLLVLDNWDTVLAPDGPYRPGYEHYGLLLSRLGQVTHQSCLLLTSRETPAELASPRATGGAVRRLHLRGLEDEEGRAILDDKRLRGDTLTWAALLQRCGWNPLALKVVGEVVSEVFAGQIAAFLAEGVVVTDGLRQVLDDQIARLSPTERALVLCLAVARDPLTFGEILALLRPLAAPDAVQDAVQALLRRSLIERLEGEHAFALQPVVLEYATDRLVALACEEIERGTIDLLQRQPLIQARAKDYVRQAQERMIGAPILDHLARNHLDGVGGVEQQLLALLPAWRTRAFARQGYLPGNVANLVRLLRGHLRDLDFSGLALQEAYLQTEMQDANLAGAQLTDCRLAESFESIYALALSADGQVLAAGSNSGEVRISRPAGEVRWAVQAHTCTVAGVALDAEARIMASGGVDGLIQLWDPRQNAYRATLHGHTDVVTGVALSADGHLLASAGFDGTVRLWNVQTASCEKILESHAGGVHAVALDAAGLLVAGGGRDGTVRLWECGSGRCLAALPAHDGPVRGVALSADGRTLVSCGADGLIRLWDTQTSRGTAVLAGHSGPICAVAITADGHLVASGGADRTVRLWDTQRGECLAVLTGHDDTVWAVAITPDGSRMASSSQEGLIHIWEAPRRRSVAVVHGQATRIYGLAQAAAAPMVVAAGPRDTVRVWDREGGLPLACLRGHQGLVLAVAVSADGQVLASGDRDGTVRVWDRDGWTCRAVLAAHAGFVRGVALSADGQTLVSCGQGGLVRLWAASRRDGWKRRATLGAHEGIAYAVALSADGQLAVSGGEDGTLRLWDLPSRGQAAVLSGHTGAVMSVALSATGWVASAGYDGTIRLWDLRERRCRHVLEGHSGAVRSVALSAAANILAGAGIDGTVRVMSFQGSPGVWACLASLPSRGDQVAVSADGSFVTYTTETGAITLWDVQAGEQVRTFQPDRLYERLNIRALGGTSQGQRSTLLALGAVE